MSHSKIKSPRIGGGGIIAGILGAATFGFIPAFSIPALHAGMSPACILFYRFTISTIIIATILTMQGKSLKIPLQRIPTMTLLAIFYCFSGGLLIMGYEYMSAGVTGVIHFSYPIFVMLILVVFYHERLKISSIISIATAIFGIYCLGVLGGEQSFVKDANPVLGVIIVVASGVACASYMVGVNKTKARTLPSLTLTFWLLFISAIFFGLISLATDSFVIVTDVTVWANLVALALIATVLSNFLLVYAIKRIGSTYAAILGAVEPVTAVTVGIVLFDEALNLPIVIGILFIFTAVGIVVMRNRLERIIKRFRNQLIKLKV